MAHNKNKNKGSSNAVQPNGMTKNIKSDATAGFSQSEAKKK